MTAIKPYPVSAMLSVPHSVPRPPYVGVMAAEHYHGDDVQTPEVIEAMREAGRIAADAMAVAGAAVAPGVTTDHLDRIAHEYMLDHGAYPATLGYRGFPKSICTSVNEVICHGIPTPARWRTATSSRSTSPRSRTASTATTAPPTSAGRWTRSPGCWPSAPRRR